MNCKHARACMLFTMLFAAIVVVDVDDQFNRSFYSFFSFLSLREFTRSRTPSSHTFILPLCLGCYLWWRLAPKHDIEHYYAFPIQLIFNLFGKKALGNRIHGTIRVNFNLKITVKKSHEFHSTK